MPHRDAGVEAVGIPVAHRDGEDARPDHVGERVRDARRIATIRHKTGETRGGAEATLRHREQHHAAIRGEPSTIDIGCDLPAADGWKREWQHRNFGHGGRGCPGLREMVVSAPKPTQPQTFRLRSPAALRTDR